MTGLCLCLWIHLLAKRCLAHLKKGGHESGPTHPSGFRHTHTHSHHPALGLVLRPVRRLADPATVASLLAPDALERGLVGPVAHGARLGPQERLSASASACAWIKRHEHEGPDPLTQTEPWPAAPPVTPPRM